MTDQQMHSFEISLKDDNERLRARVERLENFAMEMRDMNPDEIAGAEGYWVDAELIEVIKEDARAALSDTPE